MNEMFRFVLAVLLGLVVVLPGLATAQDGEWTCGDDLLAAVQATSDEASDLEGQARFDKLKEAYWLAAHAEALCVGDLDRFHDAQQLRSKALTRLQNKGQSPFETVKVDLGDYELPMICMGEGSPTVIFEHGYGSGTGDWADIQPAISTFTRTCSYNRGSAKIPEGVVLTTQDQVDNLLTMLALAEIDPPYVFVAHSHGGWNALLFTNQNPELVAGLVLLEASHPDIHRRWCDAGLEECGKNRLPDDPDNIEHLDFAASELQVAGIDSVGDIPLVVISAAVRFGYWDEAAFDIWYELQPDLVTFSGNSRHIILENSDHFVQGGSELHLVIEGILWVIDEARAAEE